jgi:hypothetical protein
MNRLCRMFIGLMAMDTTRVFYADANFSILTYGKVEGYRAWMLSGAGILRLPFW